jgi:RNA polymerase sigma factor (sigma-70 family)
MVGVVADPEFEAFFGTMFIRAVAVARRITGDAAVAEEIASETFVRAYVRWKHLSGEPTRSGWVVRVASNLAIDHVRRRPPVPGVAGAEAASDDAVVLRLALVAALRRLSRREREVITLRYLADMSEVDAAAALGLSAGSVKTYVHRGLAHLRPLMSAYDEHDVEGRLVLDTE